MKKSKQLIIITATFLLSLNVHAQTMDKAEANAIIANVVQHNTEYIFSDATRSSQENAKQDAMELLSNNVQLFLEKTGVSDQTIINELMSQHANCVFMKRGDKDRAFVYIAKSSIKEVAGIKETEEVKKDEILPVSNPEPEQKETVIAELPETAGTAEPESVTAEPESVTAEPESVTDQREIIIKSKNDNAETFEDGGFEDFDEEDELIDTKVATETYTKQEVMNDILRTADLKQLQIVMGHYKKQGAVLSYDRYQKIADPASYYVVIHDKKGNIVAILSPGRKSRTNLWNNKSVRIEDYAGLGYGAIAFRLAKLK